MKKTVVDGGRPRAVRNMKNRRRPAKKDVRRLRGHSIWPASQIVRITLVRAYPTPSNFECPVGSRGIGGP